MTRKFIATICAAALAVTSLGAVPARADNDDLARALVGIGALAIIGTAIHNEKKKDRNETSRRWEPDRGRDHGRHDDRWGRDQHRDQRWNDRDRHRTSALPGACLVRTQVDGRSALGYDVRCLNNSVRNSRDLPQSCVFRTSAYQGPRHIYGANCMARQGYEVAYNR